MANTDNTCAHLEVPDRYPSSTRHLADIMEHQKMMQEKTYGFDFSKMTLRDLMDYWHVNNHALIDEVFEATDALGGVSGDGSAIWKNWKKAHAKYSYMTLSDLSDSDRAELHMEIVDVLHFFINMAVSVGMTPEMVYNMYFSKAAENVARQERGY